MATYQLQGVVANRPGFAHVEFQIPPGQAIKAGGGRMLWMNSSMHVDTQCGDCGDACLRSCARESCCQNTFVGAGMAPSNISFGLDLPGDILPFGVAPGNGWVLAPGSFICGSPHITVSGQFSGCAACLCGPQGPFLTHITAVSNGIFYAGGYGALTRHEVPAGKTMYLNMGCFFAAADNVNIELTMPLGCTGFCCGGAGPVVCAKCCGPEGLAYKFTGPCVVYSQNRDSSIWKKLKDPPPPKQQKAGGVGGIHH